MNIKIHSIHFDADSKLESFIESKVEKLSQFYDSIIGAEIFLRLDKAENTENKITEIKVEIPGNDLFAKRQSASFEASTDAAIEALRRQISKHKEKQRGL
jgi:putative sigma-54 modulation protein